MLHLRTPQTLVGVLLILVWLGAERSPKLQARLTQLGAWAERHHARVLLAILAAYVIAATAAKFSQLQALALNANDFWLFDDMLAQLVKGPSAMMLTRFAPQAPGWVQHGAVSAFLTWALWTPVAAITGSTWAALLFGPVMIAGAGYLLARLTEPSWGKAGSLLWTLAWLGSSLVSRTLMYDVHPEAAYPLCVLLWAWAAGWSSPQSQVRPLWLLIATALTMGIKQDSFLVLPPLIAATAVRNKTHYPWLATSAVLCAAFFAFHFVAIGHWADGSWGPLVWEGRSVTLPHGPDLLKGRHWSSPSDAVDIVGDVLAQHGGITGFFAGLVRYLFSRPWLSLLILAPWVVLSPSFWVSVGPLVAMYSVLETPGKFLNYYSMPVLGLFWLAAAQIPRRARSKQRLLLLWVLGASWTLGGSGLDYSLVTPGIAQERAEVTELVGCLPQAQGVVSGRYLGLAPRDRVLAASEMPGASFYLFSIQNPSFEIPAPTAQSLASKLRSDNTWTQLGKNCRPANTPGSENEGVLLFVKKQ